MKNFLKFSIICILTIPFICVSFVYLLLIKIMNIIDPYMCNALCNYLFNVHLFIRKEPERKLRIVK
jgi:hypothetical protein